MKNKVYLLEDDASICELVNCTLDLSGIPCECFSSAGEFFAAMEENAPDLALIDIMLPDANGLDVLKKVKARFPETGAIILSALGKETDKVKGLNAGADDYISKPFGVLELTARVNAVLRRQKREESLKTGDLEMDVSRMRVTLGGRELALNNKEFQLLRFCMQNAGKVLSREEILSCVWGYEGGETRTLDNHIARLRKLGVRFETVFGVGYKLIAD